MKILPFLLFFFSFTVGEALAEATSIVTVEKATTRPACCKKGKGARNAAVFMNLTVPEGQKDILLEASCDRAERVELHTHIDEGGILKMRPIKEMEIEGTRVLKSGGDHIMLMGLKKSLKKGEKINLTLRFKESGEVTVPVVVEAIGTHAACKSKKA